MDLAAALCALHREVAVLYGSTARRFDLTLQQAELLIQVHGGSVSSGELARRLGCDKSNITGMVDRLDRRGLLRREPDPDDRRITRATLTEDGTALAARIRAEFAAVVDQRCAELSTADTAELARLADTVTGALAAAR
nr:MarR family transcriptional regulator [Kibdelosporangium sp. MJ126-NF4]CEL22897.1 Transcriptional regulator, MarR family [Kibdelosporangium sp. MJ126-NF4]CTQ90037.1 Transcriptional regulator, MarR family [Kibdelosporangium sp. MJ126-NF4]